MVKAIIINETIMWEADLAAVVAVAVVVVVGVVVVVEAVVVVVGEVVDDAGTTQIELVETVLAATFAELAPMIEDW